MKNSSDGADFKFSNSNRVLCEKNSPILETNEQSSVKKRRQLSTNLSSRKFEPENEQLLVPYEETPTVSPVTSSETANSELESENFKTIYQKNCPTVENVDNSVNEHDGENLVPCENNSTVSPTPRDSHAELDTDNVENFENCFECKVKQKIVIPPRSTKFVTIKLPCDTEMLCLSKEIGPGIFLANSLIKPIKNKTVISILNCNEKQAIVKPFTINLKPLVNYNIMHFNIIDNNNNNRSYFYNTTKPRHKKKNKNRETEKTDYSTTANLNSLFLEKNTEENDKAEKRIKLLETNLRFANYLNQEELTSVKSLCEEYNDIFHLPGDKLSYTSTMTHTIALKSDQGPVNLKMYRLPESQKEIIHKQVQEMLENDIITPSKSPFNSPLLVVPKKDGPDGEKRWRVVVDFRKLNEITIPDIFPLPRMEDILDQLGHARYFSTLDLASGYHQVLVDEKDRGKTAFSTSQGHYEFKRMPFGLSGAPSTFQRMMNHVLVGMNGVNSMVYLDDIVLFGKSLKEHNEKLKQVFERLRTHNLKLQPEKCDFLKKEVVYLGHHCSIEGVKPDPNKIKSVIDCPTPRTVRQVRSFLGLANFYRKFIQDFSKTCEPLNKILRKNAKFIWTEECEEAMKKIKQILTNPPVLMYPDFNKTFILSTDASGEALGAVLAQESEGIEKPIAYASRTLNPAERRYSTTERELLAIVWATKTFRSYVYGREFVIYTDHRPLKGFLNLKDTTTRVARFQYKLSDYTFKIEYRPGKTNQNADALSRLPVYQTDSLENIDTEQGPTQYSQNTEKSVLAITRAQAKQTNSNTDNYTNIENKTVTHADVTQSTTIKKLHKDSAKTLTDGKDIQTILKEYHDSPLGGHLGVFRTYKRIRPFYRWRNMLKTITQYIKKCEKCKKNKAGKQTKMPMVITDTPEEPFDKVYLDIVGPLPVTEQGNRYILTFQDDLTKFFDCFPLSDCEANTVAVTFYKNIILKYCVIPRKLITDQGTNFLSNLFKELCKLLKIKKLQTTAYHPQSNGSLERSHGPLVEYLRNIVDDNPTVWDDWLGEAVMVHNHTPHSGSKFSPVHALYGINKPLPSNLQRDPEPVYNYDSYCLYIKNKMQQVHKISKQNLLIQKQISKNYYDRNVRVQKFHIGDKVFLRNNAREHKLSSVWKGPYEVKKINSDVNTTIKIGRKLKTVHNNRLKLF